MRRTSAALLIALAVAGCGSGNDGVKPAPGTPITPFNNVVTQADDVAGAVDQRTADLESQLNN